MVENNGSLPFAGDSEQSEDKDFTVDDLALLKEILLSLEKAVDEIVVKNPLAGSGETFEGGYIFDLLQQANVSSFSSSVDNYNYLQFSSNVIDYSSQCTGHFKAFGQSDPILS